jgi:hypothetical protein
MTTEVAFGPVDDTVYELGDAAFGSANPPTIEFHQHGAATIDWGRSCPIRRSPCDRSRQCRSLCIF